MNVGFSFRIFLSFFCIKQQSQTSEYHLSLKEYLKAFVGDSNEEMPLVIDLEYYINEIKKISNYIFDNSQVECLNYVAGYAVFSYLKQSRECIECQTFLTSPRDIQVYNDTNFSLIHFLDRGSLKYPSECVYQSVSIMYEIFLKIDSHSDLSKSFYEGSCRRKLVQLAMLVIEKKSTETWRDWCVCMVSRWEILEKVYTTVANCILSKKVKNYNAMVIGRDNSKLQKYSN